MSGGGPGTRYAAAPVAEASQIRRRDDSALTAQGGSAMATAVPVRRRKREVV
jgi:hypothetical protein